MSSPQDERVFDEEQALQKLGGNKSLFLKMAEYFLSYSQDLLRPMRAAQTSGDWLKLRDTNHKLMGSVCNFGSNPALDAARRLEATIDNGRLERVGEDFAAVEQAVHALNVAFRARLDLPH